MQSSRLTFQEVESAFISNLSQMKQDIAETKARRLRENHQVMQAIEEVSSMLMYQVESEVKES